MVDILEDTALRKSVLILAPAMKEEVLAAVEHRTRHEEHALRQ